MATVDVDVLIVGGGAQGLWLLRDLTKRNYRTVLLEKSTLGSGQTCHSHGLIHRGHYYDDTDMMIVLNAAAQFWQAFVDENGIKKLNPERALAGFGPGTAVERHTYFWRSAGLRFEERKDMPPALAGGRVARLFETDEFSLDTSEVVACLASDIDHATYKLDESSDALRFITKGRRIERVEAVLSGKDITFRPKCVALTAGVGNYDLLEALGVGLNSATNTLVQAQRKSHMLLLRGDDLPMMTAVFPIRGGLQGVFLCSRRDAEANKNVWLVSDHNSTPFPLVGVGSQLCDPAPSSEWIKRMMISLQATAPALLDDRGVKDKLEVAVYTGLTSERNFGAGQHMTDLYIDAFHFANLFAIWPTKLTMTPFASNVATRLIRLLVEEPAGAWPRVDREITAPSPTVCAEMWQREAYTGGREVRTAWTPFGDFMNAHGINGV